MRSRSRTVGALAAIAVAILSATSDVRAERVDVAIVLAIDESGSVSDDNWILQRDGLASALESVEFYNSIRSGYHGRTTVSVVTWSTTTHVSVPWTLASSRSDLRALADRIRSMRRVSNGMTCIARALKFSREYLVSSGWPAAAERMIIDVSGDGSENCNDAKSDANLETERSIANSMDVTINGLPILASEADVDVWYEKNLIVGPSSFSLVVEGFADFERAMKIKLVREVSQR